MNKMNLIFFKTPFDDKIIHELTGSILSHSDYFFQSIYNPKDVISKIPTMEGGIFLFYINDKYDLQDTLLILKTLQKFSHGKFFKFFSVLTFDYTRSEKLLKKLGCLGFYTPADKPVKMAKKMEALRMKMLPHLGIKKNEDIFDLPLDIPNSSQKKSPEVIDGPIMFISALEIPSDSWIIKSSTDCSFTTSMWKVNVQGPSAHLGKWEDKTTIIDTVKIWKFVLNDSYEASCFSDNDGSWFFEGERPVYDWSKKHWIFQAKDPHLYFENSLKEKYSRFYFENSKFIITENSELAMEKEALIEASGEVKINKQRFKQLNEVIVNDTIVREFSLESGEISVNLEYESIISDVNLVCDFEDMHEKELIVLAPHNTIQCDSRVRAQVLLKYRGREAGVICHGKIMEIEALNKKDSITIGIDQMNKEKFKEFLNLYSLRQANINDFMTRARGFSS